VTPGGVRRAPWPTVFRYLSERYHFTPDVIRRMSISQAVHYMMTEDEVIESERGPNLGYEEVCRRIEERRAAIARGEIQPRTAIGV